MPAQSWLQWLSRAGEQPIWAEELELKGTAAAAASASAEAEVPCWSWCHGRLGDSDILLLVIFEST